MQIKLSESKNKKSRVVVGAAIVVALLIIYLFVHLALNIHTRNIYANAKNGFRENVFGDYNKKVDGFILNYYDPKIISFKTNISIGNDDVVLITWISTISDKKKYGLLIHDHEKEITRQIKVDNHLRAYDNDNQTYIDDNIEVINKLKETAEREWGDNLFS